jgi:hypothetical protein
MAKLGFLFAALAATGCALDPAGDEASTQSDIHEAPNTAVTLSLTVSGDNDGGAFLVTDSFGGQQTCAPCQLTFNTGFSVKITQSPTVVRPDCIAFKNWTGACAGQFGTAGLCTLTLTSDMSAVAVWGKIGNCTPR